MNGKLTTGFYVPTPSFQSIPEHFAVMYEDNHGLVALCGPVDDDPEKNKDSMAYAKKFAAVDDLIKALAVLVEEASQRYPHFEQEPETSSARRALDAARAAIAKAQG